MLKRWLSHREESFRRKWKLDRAKARRNRASEQLKGIFIHQAQNELQRYLPYSLAVHEIEVGIGRLQWFTAARPEDNVATARKVRATFNQLAAFVEAEENIELIVGASW